MALRGRGLGKFNNDFPLQNTGTPVGVCQVSQGLGDDRD